MRANVFKLDGSPVDIKLTLRVSKVELRDYYQRSRSPLDGLSSIVSFEMTVGDKFMSEKFD